MTERFVIEGLAGAKTLSGTVSVRGAKNAVLKALASSVLFEGKLTLQNVPEIEDVHRMCEILASSGATVTSAYGTRTIESPHIWKSAIDATIAARLRSSIVLTGPLLARTGEVSFPMPGGDMIGDRPINLFLSGFRAMGAEVCEENGVFVIRAKEGLHGAHISFPFISVTATETLAMAAVLAKGETVLENVAMEPEVNHLLHYLVSAGADITGIGTPTLTIRGGGLLRATEPYVTLPDRIEAGSFAILGALAGNGVRIESCDPSTMGAVLTLFTEAGIPYEVGDTWLYIPRCETLKSVSVRTHEYPGFPTDLQAPMAVLLSQAQGEGSIFESIYDGRFRYIDDLVRMGADAEVVNPHRVLVRGPKALRARTLESLDIRAGLACLIAATLARGTSVITNAYVIDRGYERIEERLQKLGATITREKM